MSRSVPFVAACEVTVLRNRSLKRCASNVSSCFIATPAARFQRIDVKNVVLSSAGGVADLVDLTLESL